VSGRAAVAVGNFDGLHRGHLELLGHCRAHANGQSQVAVVTFEPLPQAWFRPEQAPARLSTPWQKVCLLGRAGVDLVWMMRFDGKLAGLSAELFVRQVLVEQLQASRVVVGGDFRFGKGRQGDVALLREMGGELGFGVTAVPPVVCDGDRISSSGIRRFLAEGNFKAAERWLGRPFRMEGHVVRGAGLGRKLGYPTANLRIRARPCPLSGVIAAFARIGAGPWLPAVTNVGRRPAVGGGEPLLEVHFFDLDRDLYGERLEVQFVAKLRDETNFGSLEELVEQMRRDERKARARLAESGVPEEGASA
jgi:riboflavin kinase/FMN adenylyltransferase